MIGFSRVVRSLAWSGTERLGSAVMLLLSAFAIARITGPVAFGIGALALTVTITFQIAAERFFHEAIVRQENLTEAHVETAMIAAATVGLVLTGILFVLASPVATMFGVPELKLLIYIAALGVLVAAPGGIVVALLHRDMAYRALASRSLIGSLCGACAGVAIALLGKGAIAIVIQSTVQVVVSVIAAAFALGRIPKMRFSWKRLVDLGGFSVTILAETLIYTGAFRVFLMIFGLNAGMSAVGFVEFAHRLSSTLANFWMSAINPIALNIFAGAQRSRTALAAAFMRASEINLAVVVPLFIGLAFVTGDILALGVGPGWAMATGPFCVFAIEGAIRLSRQFAPQVFYAAGRPIFALYGAIVGFVVTNGMLLWLEPIDPTYIAVIWTARLAFTIPVSSLLLWHLTGLSPRAQASNMLPPACAALIMTAVLWGAHRWFFADFGPALRLGCEIILGATVYVAALFRIRPSFQALLVEVGRELWRGSGEHGLQKKNASPGVGGHDPII